MLFRRVSVRNFRKFVSPIVIEGLGDGLTIISGDNEEGKSTLLDAIRTALFERHNLGGKAVENMQPFGSSVRPEIQIDFDINGEAYSITKAFAQRPSAHLATPSAIFEGPEAEERLAELLSFRVPSRGESKPDDRGVLGLFWLEQARPLEALGFGEAGRSTLRTSLEKEVGDVLGGARGRMLLEAARARRGELLTNTGRQRGELAASIEAARAATARVTTLENERREYDREIDELARVRVELAQLDADRVAEKAQEALASAEERAQALERLRQDDDSAGQAVALADAQFKNSNDHSTQRQSLTQALSDQQRAKNGGQATLSELEAETEEISTRLETAQAALTSATEATGRTESRVALARTWARVAELNEEVAGLDRRLSEVNELVIQRVAAEERLVGLRIDQPAFLRIQNLETEVREARVGLRAIATRLCFFPTDSQVARTDNGQPIVAGEPLDVTEASRFLLDGFGAVEVDPGASDLAELRSRLKGSGDQLVQALNAAGVADLANAADQLAIRTQAENEVNAANRMIAAHAPDGVSELRTTRANKFAERERLIDETGASSAAEIGDPDTETSALERCKSAERAARAALDGAHEKHREHATRLALANQALHTAEEAFDTTRRDLESARLEISDADLATGSETARRCLASAQLCRKDTKRKLSAADPDEVKRQWDRAKEGLRTAEGSRSRLRTEAVALENRLIGLGQSGVGELLEDARGQEAQAIGRRDRLQADAQAWDLLVTTLSSAERDAKRAFLGPVMQRVEPFLHLLLPNLRIKFEEETLEITEITRDGREEPYSALSIGTREQLSILVRLAFAVYLRERGYPAAVILDDALVYADPNRLELMQSALRKAAETVQILILTCRPRDWRIPGVRIRHLTVTPEAGARISGRARHPRSASR
jgi:hypothetical protein